MTHCFRIAFFALATLVAFPAAAQNVSGTVATSDYGLIPGANVVVDGTFLGRATNAEGRFALDVDFSSGPRVLRVSYTGYETQRVTVSGPTSTLQIVLQPQVLQGGDVVVSASRQEETILEAPVTIERIGSAQLARMPLSEIVSSMDRLKGVDVSRSSMLISSISTRGFNSAKAERVIQIIDGVDFMEPSLSLYLGNITGVPEIDIDGIEIVYGANSALYGANAFNGVVQYQTISPFLETGLSAQARTGGRGLMEFQGRFAQKVNDRLAFKLVGSFFQADDFVASNFSTLTTIADNFEADGSVRSPLDPRGADVVNRYGEAVALTPATCLAAGPTGCALTIGQLGLQGAVFTPGFTESDLVESDFQARATRLAVTGEYLVTDAIKATLALRTGQGNGIYQSSNRYAVDGFGGSTAALTVEGEAWTTRAYVIDSDQGDTYDLGFLGSFMNLQPYVSAAGVADPAGRNYATVYGQTYAGTFAAARQGGASVDAAYAAAAAATAGIYPTLGEARFAVARDATLASTTPGQSPRFDTNGKIYHADAQYRIDLPAEVGATVGGSLRLTRLLSNGTLYSDGPNSPLADPATGVRTVRDGVNNDEYGAYLQLRKAFLGDALKLSAVGRVDGFRNFDARFSPRVSGVYSFGDAAQHNLRASFSQAYRQPAQLDQFIYLDVGRLLLVGNSTTGFETASLLPATFGQPGERIEPLRLERMNSVEVGYKGILGGKLFADVSYYRSVYNDFIGTRRFLGREAGGAASAAEFFSPPAPGSPGFANRTRAIQTWLNADQAVTSQGVQLGLEYALDPALVLAGNYAWANIEEIDDLILGFNTPEHKVNFGASGQVTRAIGYGANLRWVDGYQFEMPFAEGFIESHITLDAQATYALPAFGVTVLAGGTNLTNSQNVTAYGAAVNERIVYVGLRYKP